jgi:putative restriction endonuclease
MHFNVSSLTESSVQFALGEWDEIGRDEFLIRHGLFGAFKYVIKQEGRQYDAKAILVRSARYQQNDDSISISDFGTTEATIAKPLRRLGFVVADKDDDRKRFWWVNQNKTREEFEVGFLWSPLSKRNGSHNPFYEFMSEVKPGDGVVSYWQGKLQGVGIVLEMPQVASKPVYRARESWSNDGWLIDVSFTPFSNPFEPRSFIGLIQPLLPAKYSPLTTAGTGKELYLTEIPSELFDLLCGLGGIEAHATLLGDEGKLSSRELFVLSESLDDDHQEILKNRTDFLGPREKERIQKSRRGQGIFRQNVRSIERGCRVTGVREISHLRASHIKPWRKSNDFEKLDGNNGLLLAPHIDHLFDGGWISFANTGDLLISSRLSQKLLTSWHIPAISNVGTFNEEQSVYLSFHSDHVFKG